MKYANTVLPQVERMESQIHRFSVLKRKNHFSFEVREKGRKMGKDLEKRH